MVENKGAPALRIENLNVFHGDSHAIQGISLTLQGGILSVVGRNGMGKSTLCNAIAGLKDIRSGSIRFGGREIAGLEPHVIHRLGLGYVPQGRRVWPSLSVDEHLRLVAGSEGAWTVERVYSTFPRLAERRNSDGTQLSGGEQKMLAIGRALLGNPKLLVMDEPTEGLAPDIVDLVTEMLVELGREGGMAVLVIEQDIGVATSVSDEVAVMVNGRISRILPASQLAADRELQQRLLGMGRHAEEEPEPDPFAIPLAERAGRTALIAGTFDTKGRELLFLRDRLRALKIPTRTVDLSTSGRPSSADVLPAQVAAMHPGGTSAVFGTDRGASVTAMAEAFARWIAGERGIGGVISAGGSGGTSLATAGMRALPIGIPKVMVSTVASGNVGSYVGPADIMMMYSVADVQGLNAITETVLTNAAHALAGMIAHLPTGEEREAKRRTARPALGLTMFGVTTPAVQAVQAALEAEYDCLVFHATGTGGKAMEALGLSEMLSGFLDLTTTEVADMLSGGVFPCDAGRFQAPIRTRLPWVGSVGALDMVNWGPMATVPEKFRGRNFVIHNPNVTLMRTTPEENRAAGVWIAARINQMEGPVRFLIPEGGVSALDAPGKPFWNPEADAALFEALESTIRQTPRRQVIRVPAHINDPAFAEAAVAAFRAISPAPRRPA